MNKEKLNNALISVLKAAAFFGVYFLGQIVVGMILGVVLGIIMGFSGGNLDPDALEKILYSGAMEISLISNIISILGCIGLLYIFRKKSSLIDKLDFSVSFSNKWTIMGISLALGVFGQFAISLILGLIPFPESWIEMQNQNAELILNSSFLMRFLSVAIMAPLAEEIVFRSCIQGELSKGLPKWGAIAISSVIFGIMHGTPIGILYATALGVLMGWLYAEFKSIIPSMIFHFAFNTVSLLLPEDAPIIFFIIFAILFAFCLGYTIYLRIKENADEATPSQEQDDDNINDNSTQSKLEQGDDDNEAL